jgi:ABC-type branched-subunit amino acid transport system substrate-binding protein
MKKKIIIGLVIVLAIAGAVIANNKKEETPTNGKPVVKIGVSLPLTGPMSEGGKIFKKTLGLKLKELSKQDTKYEYQITVEDDSFDTKRELLNAQRFINLDKVDALISFSAGAGYPIAQLAKEKEVIHFDFTWGDDIVESSDYSFNYFTQPCDMNRELIKEISDLGYETISILAMNHVGVDYSMRCFREEVDKYPNLQIVDEQKINMDINDMSILTKKMAMKNPDVYLQGIFGTPLELWGKELKMQGIETPIIGTTTFTYCKQLDLFNGVLIVENATPSSKFINKFKEEYKEFPQTAGAAVFYYDIIDMLVDYYEKYDEKPSTSQIKDDLLSTQKYMGEVGEVTVDKDGRFLSTPSFKTIKNGKIELLEEK